MAQKTWTLTDVDNNQYVDQIDLGPDDVAGAAGGYSVHKRTLRGGLRDGVDVIKVDNGSFCFTVVPTRGMGLWRASLGEVHLGWQSPVRGPVHPGFVRIAEPSGLGWLDGFDELLVRCGLESNGAPEHDANGKLTYPLHGKIANLPAHKTEVTIDGDTGQISVSGEVDEMRLFFNKLRLKTTYTTKLGQAGVTVTDTVSNVSAEPNELQLLYHINFGVPLLNAGSKLVAPVATVAPRDAAAAESIDTWDTYDPQTPGSSELCYFFDLVGDSTGRTHVLLHNAAGNQGVSLAFNKNQLPYFTQWKSRQAAADGYVTGLEPAINFPNARSFEKEKGRVDVLQPGESREFEITIEAHDSAASVEVAKAEIAKLQAGTKPDIRQKPNPDWSA